jgi:pimeloyl-ACP methyl ester carboxylesterase
MHGFKIFRLMADHFTRQGIAVLRYDDRGVGGSSGNVVQATTADFAGDVVAAVDLLRAHREINGAHIGLLGHSEGGIVAPLAALRSDHVSFIVLVAGAGVPGHEILQAQLELVAPTEGLSEAAAAERLELERRSLAAVRSGRGFAELEADLRRQLSSALADLPEAERQAITDVDGFVERRVQIALDAMRTPWLRFFLDYDPAVTLQQVTMPVLAVFGELDRQVPAEPNQRAMERALAQGSNPDVTAVTVPGANHLFQKAITGSPSEYPHLEKDFVPGFLALVSRWILERAEIAAGAS